MSPDLVNGIAPAHRAALGALVAAAILVLPAARIVRAHAALGEPWAVRMREGWARAGAAERWAAALLFVAGVIHVALPLGHDGGAVLTVAFLCSGAAYGWLTWRVIAGGRWRGRSVVLILATLAAYLVSVTRGEEVDQVGLATALVEMAALGLALGTRRRALAATVVLTTSTLFGVASWVSVVAGHDTHGAGDAPDGHHHHHGRYLARAQAGIIMRPGATGTTPEQQRAATELAAGVRAATAKYQDIAAAVADGYEPDRRGDGLDLQFEHKGHQSDSAILDPSRPEMLVFARAGGRAVLLGVVFQMPRAGQRGPQVGGATTTWHAHNLCVGLLPPGFSLVTPYGTCPFLTAQVTVPEMMHVWVVESAAGPFADALPEPAARQALARYGRPAP
jgi:hypothetical protein